MSGPDLQRDNSVKGYSVKSDEITSLIGEIIEEAFINENHDVVIFKTKNKETIYLSWSGDCCAKCYLAHVSGIDFLIGHEIKEIIQKDWVRNDAEDGEVVETMGTTIKTSRGLIDFESRVEHNGYYGGEINISRFYPIDNYSSALLPPDEETLSTLKDF